MQKDGKNYNSLNVEGRYWYYPTLKRNEDSKFGHQGQEKTREPWGQIWEKGFKKIQEKDQVRKWWSASSLPHWAQILGESESEVAQSCLTLCDPMVCSLPGSSFHGILQARESPSPGDLPNPRIEPRSRALQTDALTSEFVNCLVRVDFLWK